MHAYKAQGIAARSEKSPTHSGKKKPPTPKVSRVDDIREILRSCNVQTSSRPHLRDRSPLRMPSDRSLARSLAGSGGVTSVERSPASPAPALSRRTASRGRQCGAECGCCCCCYGREEGEIDGEVCVSERRNTTANRKTKEEGKGRKGGRKKEGGTGTGTA